MIAWCIRNWLLSLAVGLALGIAGLWAWTRVPVDAIPDLSDNQVIVWAEWPGKSPEDVDEQITRRLARELQGLPGVAVVRGMSLTGTGYVYVIFDDDRDLYECRTRTLERLSQIQGLLPAGVQARLGPDATAMGQVFAFALQGPADPERKRYVLDQVVIPALQGVRGVSEVAPAGGVVREYQIDVDPTRLEEQGITIEMLMDAVKAAGRDVGAMSVEQSGVETMVRGRGFIRSAADVERIVIRGNAAQRAGLLLGDIATVQVGGAVRQGLLADQHGEQVGAIVAMRVGEDPKTVIGAVKERLAGLSPTLAEDGLLAVPFYDRSQLILETNQTLARVLIEELIVTCLVIVVFMLHARASLAVALALPLGVLATFLAMHLLGMSANIMSLAGIAIAIGVMVDFGIVVCENVTQHLAMLTQARAAAGRPPPTSPFDPEVVEAVTAGTREVSRALLTAAATTIISFIPLFLLDGQAGRLFHPLAATKTLAIAAAVLFGMLLVPVLCRLLLPPWQARRPVVLALSGVAAGMVFAMLWGDGIRIPLDHGRWAVVLPGLVAAPLAACLAAYAVWRLGREELVSYEENPVSHGIAVAYDWALTRVLRHKVAFTLAIATVALTGWTVGAGWATISWPLRQAFAAAGGDLTATAADAAMRRAFPGIGASFLPPLDEGSLLFMPSVPATAGLGETQRVMQQQNEAIAAVPEVAGLMGKLGRAETALDPAPIGMIETVVLLKPYREWPLHEFAQPDGSLRMRPRTLAEVRQALAAASDIPGVAPSWLQPIETRVVMLSTGIRSLMALQILGDDQAALERFAEQAEKVVQRVPGAADVQMQREGGKPYAEIRLDQRRMARFGITSEAVMAAVESALGGMPVATSVEGTQRYGVRIRYPRERRDDRDEFAQLQIPVAAGHGAIALSLLTASPTVYTLRFDGITPEAWRLNQPLTVARNLTPLSATTAELTVAAGDPLPAGIADPIALRRPDARTPGRSDVTVTARREDPDAVTWTIGPMAIRSEGGKRTQYVLLNAGGRAEVDVVRDADRMLREAIERGEVTLPAGATYRWVGRFEQKMRADQTMTWVIGLAMGVMLVLILWGTRSLLTTTIIITCNVTVTTAGGFLAVHLYGAEMTTAVIVGFLVLLGVMFNDGILLGTYLHDLFRVPPTTVAEVHRRVFQAGLRRRRPAIMTNCTTLLALIPILWSDGRGAELMRPMVLPVIGGMLADYISLFSVPVFYAWWWEAKLARRARAGDGA
ncbi:MAG: efflux RND transporter permease subunit [Planctomycetes bacterium]|nr:efflux RND transporter permease subunit [Planctomycetota bacterium]